MQMANAEDKARQLRFEASTRRYAGATGLQQGRLNASAQKLAGTANTILGLEKVGSDAASKLFGMG